LRCTVVMTHQTQSRIAFGFESHWSIDVSNLHNVANEAACIVDPAQHCRKKAA
jgi:hypothetical protein